MSCKFVALDSKSDTSAFELNLIPFQKKITIDRTADWWLGVLDDDWFCSLEKSVKEEWGVQPLQIREGGVSLCMCHVLWKHCIIDRLSFSPSHRFLSLRKSLPATRSIFRWVKAR